MKKRTVAHPFPFVLSIIICNHYTFCSFRYIFYLPYPSRNTFPPNSRAPFPHRNQDKPLYPYTPLPARQISFRKFCIYTVKRACFFLPLRVYFFIIRSLYAHGKIFASISAYKITFPLKKPSKKPCTSNPDFSNAPSIAPTSAIAKRFVP